MPDLVRVRINGFEKAVGREYAEIHELEVLDESAYGDDGTVLPDTRTDGRAIKPKTTVDASAAKKKESSR